MPLVWLIVWIGTPLLITAFLAICAGTPDYTRRIAGVVYAIAFCLWAIYPYHGVFKLGIDLSGGTTLLYQVKQAEAAAPDLDAMVAAIQRRVNPIGMLDVTIRGVGADRVEIVIPKASADEVDRCKKLLTDLGTLEFRILANKLDHKWLIDSAEALFPEPVVNEGQVLARWVPIAKNSQTTFVDDYGGIAIHNDEKLGRYILVINDGFNVTGDFLRQASATIDELAAPAVRFRFDSEGARRFGRLTGANQPTEDGFERRLGILLNGEVYSAPSLRSQIQDQGVITGHFEQQEVDDLVAVLNAGSLPGELIKVPISEMTVGPSLGHETIQDGLKAISIASVGSCVCIHAFVLPRRWTHR